MDDTIIVKSRGPIGAIMESVVNRAEMESKVEKELVYMEKLETKTV